MASPDSATTCNANNFQIGFVDDEWTASLTWGQVAGSPLLANPSSKITFVAANLTSYSPSLSDLDRFSDNLKLNNGRLSFWVKRWCQANAIRVANSGIDDHAFRGNNFACVPGRATEFLVLSSLINAARPVADLVAPPVRLHRLTSVVTVTCHRDAICSGAMCACAPNYYGDGYHCERTAISSSAWFAMRERFRLANAAPPPKGNSSAPGATCTNNVATGFYFNVTEIVLAGENATTTQCPPGSAGYATRMCLWNGANSSTGVWAEPYSNCKRTKRVGVFWISRPALLTVQHTLPKALVACGHLYCSDLVSGGGRAQCYVRQCAHRQHGWRLQDRICWYDLAAMFVQPRHGRSILGRRIGPCGVQAYVAHHNQELISTKTLNSEPLCTFAPLGGDGSDHLRERRVWLCQLAAAAPKRPKCGCRGRVSGGLRAH